MKDIYFIHAASLYMSLGISEWQVSEYLKWATEWMAYHTWYYMEQKIVGFVLLCTATVVFGTEGTDQNLQ